MPVVESNGADEKQQAIDIVQSSSPTDAKRKIGDTFDLPVRKSRNRRRLGPSKASVQRRSEQSYWHVPGISQTELMPTLANRTYLYLNEGDYTVGTKQLEELRLMFHKYIGREGKVRADRWGYYIIFSDSKQQALERARECFREFRFQRFEDAIMPMMLFHKGECVMRCHLDKEEFDQEDFVWVGDALLKSLG